MSEQLSLAGFEPERNNHALFFALRPDEAAAERIERLTQLLRRRLGLTGESLGPGRFHVSLHGLGEYPELPPNLVPVAKQVAATIVAAPFDVTFDRVMSFRGKRGVHPLVLCAGDESALAAFYRTLGAALNAHLRGRALSRFTPHVTLAYDRHEIPEQPVEPISWTVRDFALIHSFLRQSRHETIERWRLTGS